MQHRNRAGRRLAGWVKLCVVLALAAAPLRASVYHVDANATGANDGSSWNDAFVLLQSALDVAIAGDEVRVADGTYEPTKLQHPNAPWTGTFRIFEGVTLRGGFAGAGAPNPDERDLLSHPTILTGIHFAWSVVILLDNSILSVIDGFTIRDGVGDGGGMLVSNSSVAVLDCTFENNERAVVVGAASGEQTFHHCTFIGNSGNQGAAMRLYGMAHLEVVQCTFTGNGPGSAVWATGDGGPTLTSCSFSSNARSFESQLQSTPSVLEGCSFQGEEFGAIWGVMGAIALRDCTVSGCGSPADQITAVSTWGTALSLDSCTFTGNKGAKKGGTIAITDSTLTARDCLFDGGTCTLGSGGAIYADDSTLTVADCRFLGNTAVAGGAFYAEASTSSVVNCRFVGNSATPGGRGGAVYVAVGGSAAFVDCLFTGNRALPSGASFGVASTGGAAWIGTTTAAEFLGCTLSGNEAVGGATTPGVTGGIRGDCTVANSILWGNTDSSGSGESAQLSGAQVTVNSSCIQGLTGGLGGAGNIGADPLFVDADGADDTVGTVDDNARLGPGSPCADAGSLFLVPADTADLDLDGNVSEPVSLDLDRTGRFADDLAVVDTGPGPAPDVDMGAYERSAWENLGSSLAGTNGKPFLVGAGTLQGGSLVSIALTKALPLATSFVCIGVAALNAPFKGGTLVPDIGAAGFVVPLPISAAGQLTLAGVWPVGLPPGVTLYFQEWFADPHGPQGFAASPGVSATTP